MPAKRLLGWLELGTSKFHTWKDRYGKANEHNGKIPRDFWLDDWERQAILDDHDRQLPDQTCADIIQTTRTEDKALRRCNLSADPGAKSDGGRSTTAHFPRPLSKSAFGFGIRRKNLCGTMPQFVRQDVTLFFANHNSTQFQ